MASKVKQFFVYARLTIIVLLFISLGVIVFRNRAYKTNFWPGADGEQVATLWLMLATAILSIIVFWVFAKTRRVVKDLKQLHAEQAIERKAEEAEKMRESLVEQERRIDAKLKRAIGPDNSQP